MAKAPGTNALDAIERVFPPMVRTRFDFEAIEPVRLPEYPGSAWRGLLGHSLRRTVCVTRQPTCRGCLLTGTCAYSVFFESPPPDSESARRYTAVPHPFVLDVDARPGRDLSAGDPLRLGINLIGPAIDFYPTPYDRIITTRDNKLANTAEAEVALAEIPFVRLRDGLPERMLAGSASFGQTVCIAQRALEPPELVIDLAGQRIRAGGETVKLPTASLAFYSTMARRRQKGMHPARWDTDGIDRQSLSEYRRVVSDMSGGLERVEDALSEGMTKEYFDQRKSRTNSALERALGRQLAAPYLIQGDGRRPKTRFGLRIEPDAIRYGTVP
jgi:hypothetical protein